MVRTSLIGLGKMGISHCAIINAHPDLELIAVCDSSAFVLKAMEKYSSFLTYTDYKKMIDENDIEALFVATPTKFHAEMVLYALGKNIHVFCEKPLSLNLEHGRMMVDKAEKNKLVNQVGYHNRFIGTFNYMKNLVERNILGNIYHFLGEAYGPVVVRSKKEGTWRSDSSQGGGCLFDYASHVVNLMQFILGDILSVNGAVLKKIFSKNIEDAVYSEIILANGVNGFLSVNWSEETYRKMTTQLTVWGTEGKIIADAQEVKIYLKTENEQLGFEKGWNIRYITDLTDPVDFYLRGEEYSAQVDYFAQCIKNMDCHNKNSFLSSYQTDQVVNMILQNSNQGMNHG